MAKVSTKKGNSNKKNSKKMSVQQRKFVLLVLSSVIFISIVCTALFGFKLYAYGKDITVKYNPNGGTMVTTVQTVEYHKDYTLKTPRASNDEMKFLYWSTDGTAKGKVSTTGKWRVSTKKEITLIAVWGESDEWTKNY